MELVDFSWNWWTFRGFFVELVVFSWIFRRTGGFFVDLFVDLVVFSWIFRGSGGFFVDFSSNSCFFVERSSKWWFFRRIFVDLVVCS